MMDNTEIKKIQTTLKLENVLKPEFKARPMNMLWQKQSNAKKIQAGTGRLTVPKKIVQNVQNGTD